MKNISKLSIFIIYYIYYILFMNKEVKKKLL